MFDIVYNLNVCDHLPDRKYDQKIPQRIKEPSNIFLLTENLLS